jgi:hypothetical protein
VSGRYKGCAVLHYADPSGSTIAYLAPRMLPLGVTVASAATTTVRESERHRLDLVAYRTLQNAELSWRIADANDAMDPFELCERLGTRLRLPAAPL